MTINVKVPYSHLFSFDTSYNCGWIYKGSREWWVPKESELQSMMFSMSQILFKP